MEDRKKKIIILTSIIVVILIITIVLIVKLISLNKDNDDNTIEVNNNEEISNTLQENIEENIVQNNEIESEINNTVNEIVSEENKENENDEEIVEDMPIADSEQEVDKETIEKQENDIEKAIRIAKENWNQDKNVSFTYEGIQNEKHIVYVRNSGTQHIATYKIDLQTETFELLQ